MRGVVSFLVAASAIAFHGPVPTSRTRRVCNVRGSPGIARLGEMLGDNNPLQALDTMKPTLSFVGGLAARCPLRAHCRVAYAREDAYSAVNSREKM